MIVTEYAEKGDMSCRLEERKGLWMREENVLDYFVQMCLALHYLHKRKILHRDLKAANVFVNAHNEIKLGDFGIARVLKYTMECAKTVVGTPYYLSPVSDTESVVRAGAMPNVNISAGNLRRKTIQSQERCLEYWMHSV
jgi:hypothetical protein